MALINCPECNKQISDKAEICVGCGSPVEKLTLLKIGNLEIAPNDFPSKMYWQDAKKACEALGNGWRLPTRDELNTLYQNKDKIGGFAITNYSLKDYWSSTEGRNDFGGFAWYQDFNNGNQGEILIKFGFNYVRAIRSL